MRKRILAVCLILLFVFEIGRPTLFAFGGPGQPEMASFTPASADNMVDLFSGDFSYNIPLLEADGYPLNLAYNAGAGMEQEASWVGLGWNLNPGAITRDVRGIPDDFKGDQIRYVKNIRKNYTVGIGGGVGGEVTGTDIGLSVGAGISYNNYQGFDLTTNAGITLGATENSKGPFSAALSINNSSMNGITFSPSVSLSAKLSESENGDAATRGGLTVSSSYNSRSGVQQVGYGIDIERQAYSTSRGADGKVTSTAKRNSRNGNPITSGNSTFGSAGLGYSLPRVGTEMQNASFSMRITGGVEIAWSNAHGYLNGFYSEQTLINPIQNKRAFGCLHSGHYSNPATDVMDYSRENEHGFAFEMPALPLATMNPDVLTVTGQGISGSYKPFANAFGVTREPVGKSTNAGLSLGGELAAGNLVMGGGNVQGNVVFGSSGSWIEGNNGMQSLGYKKGVQDSPYEDVYYQEANEKSQYVNPAFYASTGGDQAVRFGLVKESSYEHSTSNQLQTISGVGYSANNNFSQTRNKRNKNLSMISAGEVIGGAGITNTAETNTWSVHSAINKHHIGEITVIGEDGKRFVYGLPVYNVKKEEVTFAVGTKQMGGEFPNAPDCATGTISYNPGVDDSPSQNEWGLDNYYNSVLTPAHAHSYLPTCILGTDYVDSDDVKGPSDGDFGAWVKFDYKKLEGVYKWRLPFEENKANFNAGIETDNKDDKASYVYGEKELVYLDVVETRNYYIKFHTEDRADGYGVKGKHGGRDDYGVVMQKLDSIQMFTKAEYLNEAEPLPIKTVHFVYENGEGGYNLCSGVPYNINANGGKLTLHEVYFTYRDSKRAQYNGYKFTYGNNFDYEPRATDRWGTYKADQSNGNCAIWNTSLNPANFPYTDQNIEDADEYASAWNITAIDLPSGGRIEVDYESDRYEFVQHTRAKVMQVVTHADLGGSVTPGGIANLVPSNSPYNSSGLKFGITIPSGGNIHNYVSEGELIYFRSLVKLGSGNENERSDFISGYGRVKANGISQIGNVGYIQFESVEADGVGSQNPVALAALQYARLHLSHVVYGQQMIPDDAGFGLQLVEAVLNSFANLGTMFTSPNKQIFDNNRAREFFLGKTWLKLKNPKDYKLGGGHRVKEIRMYDQWDGITGAEDGTAMKRVFDYTLENGRTSGVASNEPMMGNEENSLLKPLFLDEKNLLAPDNKYYVEQPFAISFFPAPSVGYSRVTVKEYELRGDYAEPRSAGTGYTAHEFYTAKDYPTIVTHTDLGQFHDKTPEVSFKKLFGLFVKNYIAFSQGFMVETNDMHGKEKKVSVYAEGQDAPIQYTTYHYKDQSFSWHGDAYTRRLVNNDNKVISANGQIASGSTIGMFYELVADSKEEYSEAYIASASVNLDASLFFIAPVPIPSIKAKISEEKTSFKYASLTKSIQKFGILEKVVSFDEGTLSEEKYLAYDGETGAVLVTQTTNNFNDSYFTMKFPAHWRYDGMGMAYGNTGYYAEGVGVSSNGMLSGLNTYYLEDGDEVVLKQGSNYLQAWVSKDANGVRVFDRDGIFPSGNFSSLRVIRSGKRNLGNEIMMELLTQRNPLDGFYADTYTKVISASGVEYGNAWRTICNCFGPDASTVGLETTNPFVMGARGLFRPLRSFTFLTNRTQTDFNENTNLRRDGVFASFSPLYQRDGGNWNMYPQGWTFATEVTEYSPEGYALANRDALGRYSSSLYGYNRSLQVAMAQNAAQREIGFDSFEDAEDAACGTDHMRFVAENAITDEAAHTGRKSIKVSHNTPVSISRDLQACDPLELTSCQLDVDTAYVGSQLVISIECFEAPVSVDYEVVQGNGIVVVNENLITISNPSGNFDPGQVSIDIVDASGCQFSQTIPFNPPQP